MLKTMRRKRRPLSDGLSENTNRKPPKCADSEDGIYRVVSGIVGGRGHPSGGLKSTGPRGPWGFESLALRHFRQARSIAVAEFG
jgi:hypothetical protein